MDIDECGSFGFEVHDGTVTTALGLMACQLSAPAFDLVQPACRCRCDMHEPVRTARQPFLDPLRFVGGVIVHDDGNVSPLGDPAVEFLEKGEKFRRAVAFVKLPDNRTGGDVESGKF